MNTERYISRPWNEIIFENRNKDYGAYILRTLYTKHVVVGLTATLIVISLTIALPKILAYFKHDAIDGAFDLHTPSTAKLASPPPIDKSMHVELMARPVVKAAVKNLPPKVTTEPVVQEELPTVEEIKEKTPDVKTEGIETTGENILDGDGGSGEIFEGAEERPHFIGGEPALAEFISKNLRYPLSAQRLRISGTVFVSFVVNTDGSLEEIKTINGISADCDKEALRLVQAMPPWEPGKNSGKPIRVRLVLPVKFKFGR